MIKHLCFRHFLLLVILCVAYTHKCIHDEIMKNFKPRYVNVSHSHHNRRLKEGNPLSYQNIRIVADYSGVSSNLTTPEKTFIENTLMPAVIEYFESLLKVVPYEGKLILEDEECYLTRIPEFYRTKGVEADLVLFVTTQQTTGGVLAWATSCLRDMNNGRPIAGQVNINPSALNIARGAFYSQRDIVIHEVTHVLGFSAYLFSSLYDPATGDMVPLESVVKNATIRGASTTLIVMPKVVEYARAHFGCPTLEGVELENEGSEMSRGSHWERRILGDEFMTASQSMQPKVSNITLALLEGTGWYKPDYSLSTPLLWGHKQGCEFVDKLCIDNSTKKPNFEEFCNNLGQMSCTLDRRYKASCSVEPSSGLPSYSSWNYFSGILAKDTFADNCPYPVIDLSYSDCYYMKKSSLLYDEAVGVDSRCFEGTLVKEEYDPNPIGNSFCFTYNCTQTSNSWLLTVNVSNHNIVCSSEGMQQGVPGYTGYLKCPDPTEFCTLYVQKSCEHGCHGRGTCQNSVCLCNEGWDPNSACAFPIVQYNCSKCLGAPCFGDICPKPGYAAPVNASKFNETIEEKNETSPVVVIEKDTRKTWTIVLAVTTSVTVVILIAATTLIARWVIRKKQRKNAKKQVRHAKNKEPAIHQPAPDNQPQAAQMNPISPIGRRVLAQPTNTNAETPHIDLHHQSFRPVVVAVQNSPLHDAFTPYAYINTPVFSQHGRRNENSSPKKSDETASPQKSYENLSPSKSYGYASPSKSYGYASPSKSYGSASPKKSEANDSPKKFAETSQSMLNVGWQLSLKKFDENESSNKSYSYASPKKSEENDSPKRSDETPQRMLDAGWRLSLKKLEDFESPKKSDENESPKKSDETPQRMIDVEWQK